MCDWTIIITESFVLSKLCNFLLHGLHRLYVCKYFFEWKLTTHYLQHCSSGYYCCFSSWPSYSSGWNCQLWPAWERLYWDWVSWVYYKIPLTHGYYQGEHYISLASTCNLTIPEITITGISQEDITKEAGLMLLPVLLSLFLLMQPWAIRVSSGRVQWQASQWLIIRKNQAA